MIQVTQGDQISHEAMEIGARVGLVGAEIVSEVKQVVKPQSPKKIVSREGKTFKTEPKANNSKLLTNIIPVMALLANITTEVKKEKSEPIKEHLQLEHMESSTRIYAVVHMEKETCRSCIGEREFKQLGIPRSKLRKNRGTAYSGKNRCIGTINLAVPCRCGQKGCQMQEVQFDVIQGLSEQAVISGPDGQRLGWVQKDRELQGILRINKLTEANPDQLKKNWHLPTE